MLDTQTVLFSYAITSAICGAVIVTDIAIRRKQLDVISSVYFGLVVGMFLSYIVGLVLNWCAMSSSCWRQRSMPALRDSQEADR